MFSQMPMVLNIRSMFFASESSCAAHTWNKSVWFNYVVNPNVVDWHSVATPLVFCNGQGLLKQAANFRLCWEMRCTQSWFQYIYHAKIVLTKYHTHLPRLTLCPCSEHIFLDDEPTAWLSKSRREWKKGEEEGREKKQNKNIPAAHDGVQDCHGSGSPLRGLPPRTTARVRFHGTRGVFLLATDPPGPRWPFAKRIEVLHFFKCSTHTCQRFLPEGQPKLFWMLVAKIIPLKPTCAEHKDLKL